MSHLPTYGAAPPESYLAARAAVPATGARIRPMTRADVSSVGVIETVGHPLDAWSADAFEAAVDALRTYVCRVAVDGAGRVVGYAVVSLAADQSDLQNLTVAGDWRRRGVGRQLLDEALWEAARRGANAVFLEVRHDNEPALALYRAYGFTATGRRRNYYARGVDAIVMRCALRVAAEDAASGADPRRTLPGEAAAGTTLGAEPR